MLTSAMATPTNVSDERPHWEEIHSGKSDESVSWFQKLPRLALELIEAAGVDRDAHIVDVGGGASRLVDALLDGGYRHITVLDIAEAALDRAKRRLEGRAATVNWIVSDVTAWAHEGIYDVWHDRASFHFLVTPERRLGYRNTLASALRPGGQAIIATCREARSLHS